MRYLLDTNACILAMCGTASIIGELARCARGDIAISSVTCYELFTGIEKCADPSRERAKVERLLSAVQTPVFDLSAASCAARIRANLESRGEMIGPYDVLIAGHAQSLSLTLVTENMSEFARVSGLLLENWRR